MGGFAANHSTPMNFDISKWSNSVDLPTGYGFQDPSVSQDSILTPIYTPQNSEWLNPSLTTPPLQTQQSTWEWLLGSGGQKEQALSPLGQGVGALSGLMSMWNGYQANQLAQKQFNFLKQAFNTNMAAAKTSYNNSLTNQANRMAARGDSALNGMTADQYVSKYGV